MLKVSHHVYAIIPKSKGKSETLLAQSTLNKLYSIRTKQTTTANISLTHSCQLEPQVLHAWLTHWAVLPTNQDCPVPPDRTVTHVPAVVQGQLAARRTDIGPITNVLKEFSRFWFLCLWLWGRPRAWHKRLFYD